MMKNKKLLGGLQRFGLLRTAVGLVSYMRYKAFKPRTGVISTATDGLVIHFDYPAQFVGSLVVFRELVEPEYRFVRRALDKNSVFCDVGCGIGFYSVCAAKLTGCTVHAFEPMRDNVRTIRENLRANGVESVVTLNHGALSGKEGFGVMESNAGIDLFSGHLGNVSTEEASNSVRVFTLDSYCEQTRISHIDVVKIDVEGNEQEVLDGAKAMLDGKRVDVMILETDHRLAGFYRSICDRGFEVYYFDDTRNSLKHVFPLNEQNLIELEPTAFSSNIVLIRRESMGKYEKRFTVVP